MIHVAAVHGNTDIAALLLKHGEQIDSLDEDSYTAMHYAALGNNTEMIQFLHVKVMIVYSPFRILYSVHIIPSYIIIILILIARAWCLSFGNSLNFSSSILIVLYKLKIINTYPCITSYMIENAT